MLLAFSPTRYVISTRRKAKRERLLLPAMDDTIDQLDQPELVRQLFGRCCVPSVTFPRTKKPSGNSSTLVTGNFEHCHCILDQTVLQGTAKSASAQKRVTYVG